MSDVPAKPAHPAPPDGRPTGAPGRIGVFGGTFDPIHEGHLAVARTARDAFDLDLVLFVPAPRPWLRPRGPVVPADDRLAMARMATMGERGFDVSSVDLDRPGTTYTADTLRDLRKQYGPGPEFYLVLGADSIRHLDRWARVDSVLRRCTLVAVGRPGAPRPSELPDEHPGNQARFIEGPMVDVSATEVRRRLAAGESCAGMLPPAVERYIGEHGLYGATRAAAAMSR
ncbi:MAG: nicotinate-nucleotide adenylyltransferase [Dehalococcoidia bacterium]|nr:nicotinate-nucleotide adenylyltransferase [Dehalococcoidia bacterium]